MAKKKAEKQIAAPKKAATKTTTKKKSVKTVTSDDDQPIKKAKVKRKKKAPTVVRMKVFWGVFNHAMKRVALYEFNQRKAAEKRATELTDSGKPPHFVMKVK